MTRSDLWGDSTRIRGVFLFLASDCWSCSRVVSHNLLPFLLAFLQLVKRYNNATVDILERLPSPFGLVRSGVAPDHPETKVRCRTQYSNQTCHYSDHRNTLRPNYRTCLSCFSEGVNYHTSFRIPFLPFLQHPFLCHERERDKTVCGSRFLEDFELVASHQSPTDLQTRSVCTEECKCLSSILCRQNVINQFSRAAAQQQCNFFGNVELGRDVKLTQLQPLYHAVSVVQGSRL